MRNKSYKIAVPSFVLVLIAALAACLYPSREVSESASCSTVHEMPGSVAVWTHQDCGPFAYKNIGPNTADSSTGDLLGARKTGKGKLSFKYTGLDINSFQLSKITYGIVFRADGINLQPAGWDWQAVNIGGGYIRNQIVSQRLDIVCPRRTPANCIRTVSTEDMQFNDPAEVFQWDCEWHTDNHRVSCSVTKPATPGYLIVLEVDSLGPYGALQYFGVGSRAYDGDGPSFKATVTDFKMTIFQ